MSETQKDQIETTGNEQCKDPCTLHHLGPELEDDHSALLSGEEENEYYDLILCFKDGDYHIADSVAAIGTETPTSSPQLCGSDGSDGGTFYDSERKTGSNVSATEEQEQFEEAVLDLQLHVAAAESEQGSQMGGKRNNSTASFSWTGSRALSSSWGDFVRNFGSVSKSSSDGSRQSTVRSSFTFPTAAMAWNGTPARLPNPRSGNPRKRVARKLLFLCCRF